MNSIRMQKVAVSRCSKSENQKKMEISRVSLFEQNFVKLEISLRLNSGNNI